MEQLAVIALHQLGKGAPVPLAILIEELLIRWTRRLGRRGGQLFGIRVAAGTRAILAGTGAVSTRVCRARTIPFCRFARAMMVRRYAHVSRAVRCPRAVARAVACSCVPALALRHCARVPGGLTR